MLLAKVDIEKRVEAATKKDEEIFKTVLDWLNDTSKILEEVEMLKKEIEVNQLKNCFNGWCPNWGSRHQLGRKATKTHIRLKEIINRGRFEGVGGRALIRQALIDDDFDSLNTLAIEIARECDGLPLALVTIGSHLRGKKDTETWKFVCEKLKKSKLEDIRHVNSEQSGVYAILKWSYDYLKTDEIKFCFLMCSLFPEDFAIPLEDLVRIGVGLDLYKDVSSIEEARRALHSMVETLKDLGLLLDAYRKEFVRMHDIVRDVCLWITSKGENIFMSKIGIDLTQLTREKGWKQYTAISLLKNKLKELSVTLVCPKLKILLLGDERQGLSFRLYGYDMSKALKVSDECFEEMKALEVVSLRSADLSLKSLQFLTNLKTLELSNCNLRDISFLAKLKKLEILSFRGSRFDELPLELSELKELRMLDLRGCFELKRIPSNLIRSFSQLEELYMEDIFEESEVEEKSIETGNARLSEVNDLPCLAVLYLKINSKCLPKDFAFSELSRYEIRVNVSIHEISESSKALVIADIDATLLTALFKALYHSVEYLSLKRVTGCEDLKCMIDASQVGEENSMLHPSLAKLELVSLPELQFIWKGPMSIHIVNFQSLTDVYVQGCKSLAYLFTLSIAQSLGQLKSLCVFECESLEFLIKIEEGDNGRGEKMLSKLEDLHIYKCKRLEYVFPVFVAAGLIQLKNLEIKDATELKQVFHGKEENEIAKEGKDIKLPNLKKLWLYNLPKLTRFFPENNHSTLPALEVEDLIIERQHHELLLPKLESLSLHNLKELKGLWKGPAHVLRWENLTTLTISGCKKLKHIFSFTLAERLGQLELLVVQDCENLEQVFYLDHEREEYVGGGDHKNVVLSKLKKLHLEGLAKLVSFFLEKYDACCPALEEFRVKDCSKLTTTFIGEEFKNLQVVEMSNCSSQLCDGILSGLRCGFFKKIKELSMKDCGVLEDELSFSNLKNLTSLTITHFNKLKHIFSPTVAPNHMLQLKTLCIRECAELEQIIDVKDGEEVGANLLQTLSSIYVGKCHKLKNLFPISIARGFQQLTLLEVIDNSELEEIFGDNDVIDEKEIQLPQLQRIYLADLPRLTNFCHVDYHFIFPAPPLLELAVKRCPKISTRFSWDEENKSVHAEAKAPKIRSAEDESHQEQAPKIGSQEDSHQEQAPERESEDDSHEETSTDLWRERIAGFLSLGRGGERERGSGKVVGGGGGDGGRRGTEAMDG
ncbi:hypothetical protein Patl1_33083 [Pistacia atlantica]|uniref:Uncharacterized protein n=1 Tax=Pistacia atlantica TaxID=434234 RepID=A0ACC1AQ98_9ROSI|nr:hypothetical protein Patl1_33083 [Pistacia atlantica]